MINTYTEGAIQVEVASNIRRKIDLSGMAGGFDVEVLYDELDKVEKPKYFDFEITAPIDAPDKFLIDAVNGIEIKPLKIKTLSIDEGDSEKLVRTKVKIKPLAKLFKKGINRFDVSYVDDEGERQASEVILDVEF